MPSTGQLLEGSGSGDAGQEIWKPAMEAYLGGTAPESFAVPPDELVNRNQAGQSPDGQPQDPFRGRGDDRERFFGRR